MFVVAVAARPVQRTTCAACSTCCARRVAFVGRRKHCRVFTRQRTTKRSLHRSLSLAVFSRALACSLPLSRIRVLSLPTRCGPAGPPTVAASPRKGGRLPVARVGAHRRARIVIRRGAAHQPRPRRGRRTTTARRPAAQPRRRWRRGGVAWGAPRRWMLMSLIATPPCCCTVLVVPVQARHGWPFRGALGFLSNSRTLLSQGFRSFPSALGLPAMVLNE